MYKINTFKVSSGIIVLNYRLLSVFCKLLHAMTCVGSHIIMKTFTHFYIVYSCSQFVFSFLFCSVVHVLRMASICRDMNMCIKQAPQSQNHLHQITHSLLCGDCDILPVLGICKTRCMIILQSYSYMNFVHMECPLYTRKLPPS